MRRDYNSIRLLAFLESSYYVHSVAAQLRAHLSNKLKKAILFSFILFTLLAFENFAHAQTGQSVSNPSNDHSSFSKTSARISKITDQLSESQKIQFEREFDLAVNTLNSIIERYWLVNTNAIENLSGNLITSTLIEKIETIEQKISHKEESPSYQPLIDDVIDVILEHIPGVGGLLVTSKNIISDALAAADVGEAILQPASTMQSTLSTIMKIKNGIDKVRAARTEDGTRNIILNYVDSVNDLKENPVDFLHRLNGNLTEIDVSGGNNVDRFVKLATARYLKIIIDDLHQKQFCWIVYSKKSNVDASTFLEAYNENFANGISGQIWSLSLEPIAPKRNGVEGVPDELIVNIATIINKLLLDKSLDLSVFDFSSRVYVRMNMYLSPLLKYPSYKPYWSTLAVAKIDNAGNIIYSSAAGNWDFNFVYDDNIKSGYYKSFRKTDMQDLDGGFFKEVLKARSTDDYQRIHSYFLSEVYSTEKYLKKLNKVFASFPD